MKKFFPALSILMALSLVPPFAFAAHVEPAGTPFRKLQRGFVNIALSPLEVVHALDQEKGKEELIPSWFAGLGRGSLFMVGRLLSGAYDMVTFPVSLPSGYAGLVAPEFVWEHLDNQTGFEGSSAR